MGSIINENIRYFKANDPYYFEVDNLPLRDLVENDKNLEEAVLAISGETSFKGIKELARKIKNRIVKFRRPKGSAAQAIGREGFDDLLPYVSGENGRIYITPGIFSARTSKRTYYHDGSFEQESSDQTVTVGEPLSQNRLKNQEFFTPGRIETFQLLPDGSGVDPSILIPSFDTGGFQYENGGNPAYRIDLIGVAGDDNPYVFLIEGAGMAATHAGQRMDILDTNIGNIVADAWENDPDSTLHEIDASANNYGKLDFGTGTKKRGAFPLPDDLFNSAGEIVNNVLTKQAHAGFGVPLAYVLVPAGYEQKSGISDSNIMDVRPFFRSAELTLSERQGIIMADPPPSNTNPLVTQKVTKALEDKITNVQTLIGGQVDDLASDLATDFSIFGKMGVTYAEGIGTYSEPVALNAGRYFVHIQSTGTQTHDHHGWWWGGWWGWHNYHSHHSGEANFIEIRLENDTTGAQLQSAFSGGDDTSMGVLAAAGAAQIMSCTVPSNGTMCKVQMSSTGEVKHAYWVRIS